MKLVMKFLLPISISLLFVSDSCFPSDLLITQMHLFAVHEDTLTLPELEEVAMKEIELLRKEESPIPFFRSPTITRRYSFESLPCIRMYHIYDGVGPMTSGAEDIYTRVLFNTCNQIIYHFGGDSDRFGLVIKEYLAEITKNGQMMDLLNLYLNTISTISSYQILSCHDDYDDVWISYMLDIDNVLAELSRENRNTDLLGNLLTPTREQIEADKLLVKESISDLRIEEDENSHKAYFYTWEHLDGKIEYWIIEIRGDYFDVVERTTVLRNRGPYAILMR